MGGRILNHRSADIACHAPDRVGQPLGQGAIMLGQGRGDALGGVGLRAGEAAQEFSIQRSVAGHPRETVRRVEPRHIRPLVRVGDRRAGRLQRRRRRTLHRRGDEALQCVEERGGINRFGHVPVHARIQALLPFLDRGVGRHGNDRKARESRVRSDVLCRLVAIHLRHLQVHQHHVVRRRHGLAQHLADRLHAVVRHRHRGTHALQQLHGDLLVNLVVFGEQNAQAP